MFRTNEAKEAKREAKRRGALKWVRFRIEYALVRLVATVLLALSFRAACRLAGLFGRLAARVDRRHRRVGIENLDRVYGDRLSRAEKVDLLTRSQEGLALGLVELLWASRILRPETIDRHFESEEHERHGGVFRHPRGAVLVSGHLGNFYMASPFLSARGVRFVGVARELDNPLLEAWVDRLRGSERASYVHKRGAMLDMLGALGRPGVVLGVLIDQNAGSSGKFVDFLGSPASTFSAPALVAKKKKVPILVGAVIRVAPMLFRFEVSDVATEEEVASIGTDALVARLSAAFGELVRRHPDQWMWTHRRWKSRPPSEAPCATVIQEEAAR
ncbi:MAG: hypothetical protein HY720_30860 [Planctomycetes bacterium]|nr:hypothetical protein [Planctomycetota bacterium]